MIIDQTIKNWEGANLGVVSNGHSFIEPEEAIAVSIARGSNGWRRETPQQIKAGMIRRKRSVIRCMLRPVTASSDTTLSA